MTAIPLLGGFAGVALVNGTQVLLTSGNATLDNTQTFVTLMDIVPDSTQRTKVLYAPGTTMISGSLAWDVKADAMNLISNSGGLLQRGFHFTVAMWTGNAGTPYVGKLISNAYASSLSLQGAAGGLISANLSFVSGSVVSGGSNIWNDWSGGGSYISTRSENSASIPYGYWYSGNANIPVKDWTLSYSQEVSPVFLNQNTTAPKYMKCGTVEVTLDLNTMEQISFANTSELSHVVIATKNFQIQGVTKTEGFTFNGPTDAGAYSYSFTSAALNMYPAQNIITP
jgi:hypothetical protein